MVNDLTEKDRRKWKLSTADPQDREKWKSEVKSPLGGASQLYGMDPLVWAISLDLHVNRNYFVTSNYTVLNFGYAYILLYTCVSRKKDLMYSHIWCKVRRKQGRNVHMVCIMV